ncbi:GNAT family N-acetyltransferase [Haloarchaeobius sp. FL176]|uniref:GNAT family N-acetyltransferase n=1 Tax=Haloarchaeobius sp. FL176 TaxID=2967129 RepID=UPI0021495C34|nr:GNAT family N-acetyltransferase [Haloarchaeobius sp. FL176]
MRVRPATPGDADAVLAVHEAAIAERGPQGYDAAVVDAWHDGRSVDDYEFDGDDTFLVATTDAGTVVGFGTALPECRDHLDADVDAEVTALYVDPGRAGEGVGTTVLEALHGHLRTAGAASAACWASANAAGFYERRGYERVATHRHEFADGVTGDVVEMQTRL